MGNRRENIKENLGLSEYPWSSEEENDTPPQQDARNSSRSGSSDARDVSSTTSTLLPLIPLPASVFEAPSINVSDHIPPNINNEFLSILNQQYLYGERGLRSDGPDGQSSASPRIQQRHMVRPSSVNRRAHESSAARVSQRTSPLRHLLTLHRVVNEINSASSVRRTQHASVSRNALSITRSSGDNETRVRSNRRQLPVRIHLPSSTDHGSVSRNQLFNMPRASGRNEARVRSNRRQLSERIPVSPSTEPSTRNQVFMPRSGHDARVRSNRIPCPPAIPLPSLDPVSRNQFFMSRTGGHNEGRVRSNFKLRRHIADRIPLLNPDFSQMGRAAAEAGEQASTSSGITESRPSCPNTSMTFFRIENISLDGNGDNNNSDTDVLPTPRKIRRIINLADDDGLSDMRVAEAPCTSGELSLPAGDDIVTIVRTQTNDTVSADQNEVTVDQQPMQEQAVLTDIADITTGNVQDAPRAKELNQNLLKLLECPVCLDWMSPPMTQCRRGHLVCDRCRERLSTCPVCRATFSNVRNRAMEAVAELVLYPCRHGCSSEVKLPLRAAHEENCEQRRYACPMRYCKHVPQLLPDLYNHFQLKHELRMGPVHKFDVKGNAEQHGNWVVSALGELFHVRVDVDMLSWCATCYVTHIGPKEKAKNYMYEVSVHGKDNWTKFYFRRTTHSDVEDYTENLNRQDLCYMSLHQAANFNNNKRKSDVTMVTFSVCLSSAGSSTDSNNESESESMPLNNA